MNLKDIITLNETAIFSYLKKNALEVISLIILFSVLTFFIYNVVVFSKMNSFAHECLDSKVSMTATFLGSEIKAVFHSSAHADTAVVTYRDIETKVYNYNVSRIIGEGVGGTIKETAKGLIEGLWN